MGKDVNWHVNELWDDTGDIAADMQSCLAGEVFGDGSEELRCVLGEFIGEKRFIDADEVNISLKVLRLVAERSGKIEG